MTRAPHPLRAVFLGCGAAARMHSRTLRRIGGVELLYGSRDALRAQAFASELGGVGSFGSYEQAVNADVDLVIVTTPTASHRELTMQALRAGKDVIVEKPAFMSSTDAADVHAVASEVGCRVFVAENYAYKPITRELRALIRSGDLGDVRFVTINATKRQHASGWREDALLAGGGPLFEGGVHWVSFAANIGMSVARVHGFSTASASSALVVFEYANGAVGTLAYSWELGAPLGGLRLSKVQGTEGAVTFESNGIAMLATGRRRAIKLLALPDLLGYRAMWSDFLSALRSGREPEFTLRMAARDLELLEQAGAATGAPRQSIPILR